MSRDDEIERLRAELDLLRERLRTVQGDAMIVDPEAETPAVAPVRRNAPVRVMLVEDDRSVGRALKAVIRNGGYQVILHARGLDALDALRERGCDVLVTDVMMPGMGGFELAKAARALHPKLPVVFMTGFAPDAAGVPADLDDPLLIKPFGPRQLLGAIEAVLWR